MKLQGLGVSSSKFLQSQMPPHPKNRLPLNRLEACSRATNCIVDLEHVPFNHGVEGSSLSALTKNPHTINTF